MSANLCEREDELLAALGRGFVHAELAAHVEACAGCSELRLIAGALLDERVAAAGEAQVPSAETMWWRVRMREQREAQARARRSLLVGQAATLAIAMVLIAALLGAELAGSVREVAAAIRLSTPLLLALTAWLVFAPIAGWVAIRQK